jgi:anti-sigma regulatory factor (Ser/Thr protein kinase)
MSQDNLRARLAAVMEHSPCGVAILAADGACLAGSGRGTTLAASPEVGEALRAARGRASLTIPGARLVPYGAQGEWLLIEDGPDAARRSVDEAALGQEAARRRFLRDVLNSATQGKLCLAFDAEELPASLPEWTEVLLRDDVSLSPLRSAVQEAARAVGIPDDRAHGAALAVGEVAMNAVMHGGGGRARLGAAEGTPGGGTVQVYVEDHGPGIALDELPRSALIAGYSTKDSMGMGFFLTLQEADRVFLRTGAGGTIIVVEVDRQPTPPLWLRRAGLDLTDAAA